MSQLIQGTIHMKHVIILFIFLSGLVFSQTYEDVVYLKDGSIIHGMIIEYAPDRHIKILSGRNVLVYQLDEIDKFTKEPLPEEFVAKRPDLSNNTWSLHLGLGNPRSLNLIGITKDYRTGEKGSFFLTAGLGVDLIGVGYSRQSNYNNNGLNVSGTLGYTGNSLALSSALSYQWRIASQGFISAGLIAGTFENEEGKNSLILPSLSFDYRF